MQIVRSSDSLDLVLWCLVADAGHARCSGWMLDRDTGLLTCVCGTSLYEYREVGRHSVGPVNATARHRGAATADDSY